jgi:hypothetical protein
MICALVKVFAFLWISFVTFEKYLKGVKEERLNKRVSKNLPLGPLSSLIHDLDLVFNGLAA